MNCPNCGHDRDENNKFCTNCGYRFEDVTPEATVNGGFAAKVTEVIKSDLFLVLCILFSGAAFFSFLSGGISVFAALFTIFFWILFASARSKNTADATVLRNVSGTVFAQKVVAWVAFGSSLFSAAIMFACSTLIDEKEFFAELNEELNLPAEFSELFAEFPEFEKLLSGGKLFVICGIVFIILAVLMLLYNLLVLNKVHRFTKSLYQSVDLDTNGLVSVKSAGTALMVMGIIYAVFAVLSMGGGFGVIAANSCNAAAWIISSVIISKNFLN